LAGNRDLSLLPFPEFLSSGLRDYAGRDAAESLDAVRRITGLPLPLAGGEDRDSSGDSGPGAVRNGKLGRAFWKALIRGGCQGAVYFLDNLHLC
jgi:hypothetical protein